jgi:hypothetical protein
VLLHFHQFFSTYHLEGEGDDVVVEIRKQLELGGSISIIPIGVFLLIVLVLFERFMIVISALLFFSLINA